MATVRLSDVQYDADVYASYVQEDHPDTNAFVASGVAVTNALLAARAAGEGDITTIPYWKDLDYSSENISGDDPAVFATPNKIGTGKMVARNVHINNAWQTANLVAEVMGTENPMQQIASRTSMYWENRFEARIQAITKGLFLENEAGTGDMIHDVSLETTVGVAAANLFNFDAFVDARATMGESASMLALMAVHPDVMKTMVKLQQIDYIQDSVTGVLIPTYNGLRVIEDKKLPVIAGTTSGFRYVTALYKTGVFGYGDAPAQRPVATEFDELAANGAGIETLIERKQWLIHPEGYAWTETTVVDESPTVAEVALPANWNRVFERENVGIAFLITNG
jgi:hypothetical protein